MRSEGMLVVSYHSHQPLVWISADAVLRHSLRFRPESNLPSSRRISTASGHGITQRCRTQTRVFSQSRKVANLADHSSVDVEKIHLIGRALSETNVEIKHIGLPSHIRHDRRE